MKNRVSVRTELADGLPFVQGDRVLLEQVILNLIINAFEAMSGWHQRAGARTADQHWQGRGGRRIRFGSRFGSGVGASDCRAPLRVLLYDQAGRFGARAVARQSGWKAANDQECILTVAAD